MTFVVSLTGFRPPPRYDAIAWTQARIEEAPLRAGPWTVLETKTLTPADTDPTSPQARNFTTTLATLVAGWYRVVFLEDDAEAASEPVVQAQPGEFPADILPPIPNDVRNRSAKLRAVLPAGSADPYTEPTLRQLVAVSTSLAESITGRMFDATLPSGLIDLALQAVTLLSESASDGATATSAGAEGEASMAGALLRSISAGPWSETYVYPAELKTKTGRPMLVADPSLDAILWALMTEDKRDEFIALATGQFAPGAAISQFDYRKAGHRRRFG